MEFCHPTPGASSPKADDRTARPQGGFCRTLESQALAKGRPSFPSRRW
jgi:hypothetical protein